MTLCDITQFWSPMSGGVRRYVTEKVKHWRARGGCHVLIIPGADDTVTGDDRARVYTIKSPLISRQTGYRVLLRLRELRRILEMEMPDLVENADPYQVGYRVARDCAALRIPSVAFYHSHFAESELRPLDRWLGKHVADLLVDLAARSCRRLYNQFARTLVPSPLLAETLKFWGVENTTVVDMGVDTYAFRPSTQPKVEIRQRLGLCAHGRILLYVGRLAAEKNTGTLCEAMTLLAARRPGEFHLIIAGEGTQQPVVEAAARATGAITWFPYLKEHARLLALYQAADVFVHPGVKETFGLVTAEAHACGLPVVGFRGTSMDRVVGHPLGFWASRHSASALSAAMEAAFQEDLPSLGRTARESTLRRFSWDKVFARQFDVYERVVKDGGLHE